MGQATEVRAGLAVAAVSLRCLFGSWEEANRERSLESGGEAWMQMRICALSLLLHTEHRPSVFIRGPQEKRRRRRQIHRFILRT